MSDENVPVGEVEQEIEETLPEVIGEVEEETTATPEEPEIKEEAEKTFTQEDMDSAIERRLARERRKIEREQARQAAENSLPLKVDSNLNPDSFESTEEYVEALATERAEAIIAHKEQSQSVNAVEEAYQKQVDEAIDKYPDYIQVAHAHKFMTPEMASAIKSSDIAVDLAYHLGTDLKEAERIFKLPSVQQIKALGKMEAKLEQTPPVTKTTSAPAPITPVQGGKTTSTAYDTTDPRSVKQMTASEWIAKDRARRGFK